MSRVRSRSGRRARATRAIRAGSTLGQLARVVRRLDPEQRIESLRLSHLEFVDSVELRVARVGVVVRGLARELHAQRRPGLALEDRALKLEQKRPGERGRSRDDLLARLHVEAVADEQVGQRPRVEELRDGRGCVDRSGASHSGHLHVREPLCAVRPQRVTHEPALL